MISAVIMQKIVFIQRNQVESFHKFNSTPVFILPQSCLFAFLDRNSVNEAKSAQCQRSLPTGAEHGNRIPDFQKINVDLTKV
jgi:hypothetical protein